MICYHFLFKELLFPIVATSLISLWQCLSFKVKCPGMDGSEGTCMRINECIAAMRHIDLAGNDGSYAGGGIDGQDGDGPAPECQEFMVVFKHLMK